MPESTKNQSHIPHALGGYGLSDRNWGYAYKTSDGRTVLPPAAALRGAGAYEGRNSYEPTLAGIGFAPLGYYPGTYETYRRMRADPTLAIARATVFGPILAAGSTLEADDDAPADAEKLIAKAIGPMLQRLKLSLLHALDYGFQAHEIVWDGTANGYRVPSKVKPLAPELTTFKVDENGRLLAIHNSGVELPMDRVLLHTNDGEGDDPYGRSRFENCRRTWSTRLALEDQHYRLAQKAAGIVVKVGYPPDPYDVPAGGTTNKQNAEAVARGLSEGRSITFPTTGGLKIDDPKDAVDLAKNSMFPIDLLNMGDTGGAQGALLEALQYYDKLMCRGWLRSERSVIEATGGGTRAESETMTANISDTDCDAIHDEIIQTINRQLIDAILVENFGEDAKGKVRYRINEIVDEQAMIDRQVLAAGMANPSIMAELASRYDWESILDRCGVPVREDADPFDEMPTPDEAAERAMERAQAMKGDGKPDDDENDDADRDAA